MNQVSPTPSTGYTYCQTMNHVFEKCPVFLAHQMLPKNMNAAFTRPTDNPYTPTYNPGWRNHTNFSWSQNKQFPPSNHQSNFSNYQQTFSNHVPQGPHFEKNSTDFEKILATFTQNARQAISRLEVQMSQLTGSLSERSKRTLASQLVANLRNYTKLIWLKRIP